MTARIQPGNQAEVVRAAAGELLSVTFTVNGTETTVSVPPRMTLADTIREHLGLTGTHLGCEHGVCGMCTILYDGTAARSCLLFTIQCGGADVVTIEGLGTPADPHPLQQAFSHHHALQCGFCTPGFILSAYDLLAHQPGVAPDQLPEQLSGVLCRCTGYRNILSAVADVAERFPEGVPGPTGGSKHALAGRERQPGTTGNRDQPHMPVREPVLPGIALREGAPTFRVHLTSTLSPRAAEVWSVLDDAERLAACLPGAELTGRLGGNRYRGRIRITLGPLRLSFEGFAHITERDEQTRRLRVAAAGADAGRNQAQADIRLRADPAAEGTELQADAAVYLSGRIAQFGRALAGDLSRRLFRQFVQALEAAAAGGAPPQPPRRSAARLTARGITAGAHRLLTRLGLRRQRRE